MTYEVAWKGAGLDRVDHGEEHPKVVVIGASSGLGRSIGVGLAKRGGRVALLARRKDRLAAAAREAGDQAIAVECDVTSASSCRGAIDAAAGSLGGIDAIVYAPAIGHLAPIDEISAETWRSVFATNVTGASLITAAALPHLRASRGVAAYLSSVAGSESTPWVGLGSYCVSKAALEKLVDAWRGEHPDIGFTRVVVGECAGGEGDSATGFADRWDGDLFGSLLDTWAARGHMTGALLDVENLVTVVDQVTRMDATACVRSVTIAPRLISQHAPESTTT